MRGKVHSHAEVETVRTLLVIALMVLSCRALSQQQDTMEVGRERAFQEQAQTAKSDTAKRFGWRHSVVAGLNLNEVAYSDWAQGGTNVLAFTPWLSGNSRQDLEGSDWSTSYKFAYGQARVGSQGVRKTDDEIYMETLFILKTNPTINPYVGATLRTQFAPGFKYDAAGTGTPISRFFDPGYLSQSAGIAWQPVHEVKTGLGLGLREIFTSRFTQYADDPRTAQIERTKVEGGIRLLAHVDWKFAENTALILNQEFFSPFETPDQVFVRSDNSVVMRMSRVFSVNVNVLLIQDLTVSPRTQIKQVMALGVSYVLV